MHGISFERDRICEKGEMGTVLNSVPGPRTWSVWKIGAVTHRLPERSTHQTSELASFGEKLLGNLRARPHGLVVGTFDVHDITASPAWLAIINARSSSSFAPISIWYGNLGPFVTAVSP
jgi:hypothetical protein